MFNFSIMPLDPLHIDKICEDIKNQYKNGKVVLDKRADIIIPVILKIEY